MELAEFLKNLLGLGYEEHTVQGRTWYLDPASNFGGTVLYQEDYEPEVTKALLQVLRPGDVFLDIGANEGWYSVRAAEIVGEGGKVFSFEPQARLWPVILRNYMLNCLHNCTLVPYAIGSTSGFVDMVVYPSLNTGASSLISRGRTKAMKRQKTGVLPLQRVAEIHHITKIRLAKIDVEGFELEVLKGAGSLLGTSIENIFVELHPSQLEALGQSTADVEQLLTQKGYEKRVHQNITLWTLAGAH